MTSELRQSERVAPRRAVGAPPVPAAGRAPGAVTAAVLLATAPVRDGDGAAALLPWEEGTVISRLLDQLASLGIYEAHVITRPDWEDAVRRAVEAHSSDTHVQASPGLDSDLRRLEALARDGAGGLVVLYGDVVTHREALAGLLADPRVSTGILAGGGPLVRPFAFRVRARRGRLVSASSPYHATFKPSTSFLGVLKVAPADRPALAKTARRLARMTAEIRDEWREELVRKEGMWRYALYRAALGEQANGEDADVDAVERPGEGSAEAADGEALEPIDRFALELSEEDEARVRERVAAAPEDAAALLVVGLVRGGAHVGASHLRKLYWARTLSADAIARARAEIGDYDEDKVLLDSAVKASDGFFTTFFVSPYSRYIARWAAHRGLTPNQVTTASAVIGAFAAAAFATGQRWGLIAGAVLLQAAFTTDCVDGQLARYTRTFSKLGAWLDSVFDRTKEYMAFAGLAIGASVAGEPVWLLACCALALQSVRHMADFAYGAGQQQVIGATVHPPLEQPADAWTAAVEVRRAARREAIEEAMARGATEEEAIEAFDQGPPPTPRERVKRAFKGVLSIWHTFDDAEAVRWLKRMIAFPIGERFAVISITAALFTPRTTFVVLLAWGGFAAVYAMVGRVLRSLSR